MIRQFAGRSRFRVSLLAKFSLLLLLAIVPISALAGFFNYQNYQQQLKGFVQAQQEAWTTARTDTLAFTLVEEAERLEAQGLNSDILRRLQTATQGTIDRAATSTLWENAGAQGSYRYLAINSDAGKVLGAYRQQFPNRAFAFLARADGELLAVTTPRWPESDLRKFAWWPRTPLRDQVDVTTPQRIPGIEGNLILILVPLGDPLAPTGNNGVLVVGLTFEQIINPLLAQGLPAQESAWLVAADGAVLAGTAPGVAHVPAAWMPAVVAPATDSSEVSQDSTGAARDMLLSYGPLRLNQGYAQNDHAAIAAVNQLSWTVLRAAPQTVAYAGLGDQLSGLVADRVVVFAALLLVALIIVRTLLLRPIRRMERAMGAVAAGDLGARVRVASRDELGSLSRSFNQMVADLDALLRERGVRQREQQIVSTQLQSSATELQTSVAQQDTFTTRQATSLSEIAATFAELSRSAVRIAQYSELIGHAADTLQDEHAAGNGALVQTRAILDQLRTDSEGLDEIAQGLAQSSRLISAVIAQLNGIADETKLLALNATIEAVGAGQAGRRFAVIANQVQELAYQSNESAAAAQESLSEVKVSIDRVVAAIQRELAAIAEGVRHSQRLQLLMQTISDTIQKLNQSVEIIEQDSRQQKEGSQTAAATVEALAAASQELAAQSASVHREAIQLGVLANRLYSDTTAPGEAARIGRSLR